MASISQLGYLGLGVTDLPAWERFATGVLGLAVGVRGSDETLYLRMDEYSYRLALHPDHSDDLLYVGWEVADAQALRAIAGQISAAGVTVSPGSPEEAQRRRVVELITFRDPNGVASEVFYGPLIAPDKFVSPRPISGFETGPLGLGHFILVVDDFSQSMQFYQHALGMRISDYIVEPFEGIDTTFGFLHCNPRHHTLALYERVSPAKRLNHFMLEVQSLNDVGAAYDRCTDHGVPFATTLGRHTNDHMVSFYAVTPSGFLFEYGWGARQVDDAVWQVQLHHGESIWGHRPVGDSETVPSQAVTQPGSR